MTHPNYRFYFALVDFIMLENVAVFTPRSDNNSTAKD